MTRTLYVRVYIKIQDGGTTKQFLHTRILFLTPPNLDEVH